MIVQSADYLGSFPDVLTCPASPLPEFAFIGRSNVGKSSLINMLCGRKDLVKVSHSPGKTKMINYFLINQQIHLVDLPGYGYAKASKAQRKNFELMIQDYLVKRKSLVCTFALIDSRLKPQKLDLDFVNQLGEWRIPFVLVFTKADKPRNSEVQLHVKLFLAEMKEHWEEIPQSFITSSLTKNGREELWRFITQVVAC